MNRLLQALLMAVVGLSATSLTNAASASASLSEARVTAEVRSLQDWTLTMPGESCSFDTATASIICSFVASPASATPTFILANLATDPENALAGALGAATVTSNVENVELGTRDLEVTIPMEDIETALANTATGQPDAFGYLLTGKLSTGGFEVISQDFRTVATVDANNGGEGFSFSVNSDSDVNENTVNDGNFVQDIDPTLLACQADNSYNCYPANSYPAIAQGSFLYLRIETTENLVVIDNIEDLTFVLTYDGGQMSSDVIEAQAPINPQITTVLGEDTKVVTVATILPSSFYATVGANPTISANGVLNFAPSSTRKLLRASSNDEEEASTGLVETTHRALQQQGGFQITGITLASGDGTSGAGFYTAAPAILATTTAMAAAALGDYNIW